MLPLLKRIATSGVSCFLVKMPLNLAALSPNRAKNILKDNPEIEEMDFGRALSWGFNGSERERVAYYNQGQSRRSHFACLLSVKTLL